MVTKLRLIWNILSVRRYGAVACVTAAGLGVLYFFLTMSMLPVHAGVVSQEYGGYIAASVALTAAVAVLGGINVAVIAFKMKEARKSTGKSNTTAFLGGAFSAFTPGCPACTAPLAVVLGSVGGLSAFPMQGLELKIISVGVLVFAVYWVARGLQRSSCCCCCSSSGGGGSSGGPA